MVVPPPFAYRFLPFCRSR